MARTIWKYTLKLTSRQEIEVPAGADLLSVAEQGAQLCLWAAVDYTTEPDITVMRPITIVGTGNIIPDTIRRFIGTVHTRAGFVWHVFEG